MRIVLLLVPGNRPELYTFNEQIREDGGKIVMPVK